MLYPIKFKSIYKTKVWGGDKIKNLKSDKKTPDNCGEAWEISAIQGDLSIVSNGFLKNNTIEEIIEIYMGEILGDKIFEKFGYEFPLLIKIIEAKENLSVQVHPNDETAKERHNARGKSEIWYILETDKNAKLVSGFSKSTNAEEFYNAVKQNSLEDLLNAVETKAGEVYYMPAGRVHSLGAGNLILEVQQTSDITYRIYDYGRKDRELHLDLAKDVIDYSKTEYLKSFFTKKPDSQNKIISNQFFTLNYLAIMNETQKNYYDLDSFVVYFCINGKVQIKTGSNKTETLTKAETILIPATIKDVHIIPEVYSEIIEIYIES
ncbi:MAG: mannose-6-phosphate isomerase, class I [Bacteroidales bacterium]|jgi:mannose-6-phosphate isomerase|nr:mannose-6-phosphate isomerase, class I [Bacteroidales bacterium]MCK9499242.1 mannose-6-phosphate isomerase, class I [Bacteroidales bacterium]MDY0314552.1 mannose-6-phosphate isomerase, class I [Bacteroidales bacterium]NLB85791.1 mannose-6-phosphate isomerase, class I [Bacteroidales bacterium]